MVLKRCETQRENSAKKDKKCSVKAFANLCIYGPRLKRPNTSVVGGVERLES